MTEMEPSLELAILLHIHTHAQTHTHACTCLGLYLACAWLQCLWKTPPLCFLVLLNTAASYRYNHTYCTLEGRVRETCLLFAYPYSLVSYNTYILVWFSSVALSCPTLCNPINRGTPGLPVHHHAPLSVGFCRQEYFV